MRARVVGMAALFVAVALAGCAGSDGAVDSSSAGPGSNKDDGSPSSTGGSRPVTGPAVETDDVGVLTGTVVDGEFLPIEDAIVRVVQSANRSMTWESTSDAEGAFRFGALPTADYGLFVGKAGYVDAAPKHVSITSGDTTDVDVVLEARATLQPHVESIPLTYSYNFFVCLGVDVPEVGCFGTSAYSGGQDYHQVNESVNGTLETIVLNARWDNPMDYCGMRMGAFVYAPESGVHWDNPAYQWEFPLANSPLNYHIPRLGSSEYAMAHPDREAEAVDGEVQRSGTWHLVADADGDSVMGTPVLAGCATDWQPEFWWSFFYMEPAPSPEWTIFG